MEPLLGAHQTVRTSCRQLFPSTWSPFSPNLVCHSTLASEGLHCFFQPSNSGNLFQKGPRASPVIAVFLSIDLFLANTLFYEFFLAFLFIFFFLSSSCFGFIFTNYVFHLLFLHFSFLLFFLLFLHFDLSHQRLKSLFFEIFLFLLYQI